MTPQIDRLSKAYEGRVHVRKINADEQPEFVGALRVYGIPTVIVYRDGHPVIRKTGALSAQALETIFSAADHGEAVPIIGLRLSDRLLRGLSGLVLGLLGWYTGPTWALIAVGGVILFSAVYDRCPVWQSLSHWVKSSL
jgi:thioredoxin 1